MSAERAYDQQKVLLGSLSALPSGRPRNTRSTPMKQNLHNNAFVPFVCSMGKYPLANLGASRWEIAAKKNLGKNASNLAYNSADLLEFD
jgi:hypothetical protein